MLKGVRGGDPVNRDALADIIVKVSHLVSDFPEIVELDLNPVFATKNDAIAADVRIVVDFDYKPRAGAAADRRNRHRDEPHHAAEGGRRDRRLRRRRQDRQLGDEEPDQRRLQGRHLSDPSQGRRDHGPQGLQERQGCARRDRHRGVRDPREIRRGRADRMRREENPGRGADPVGLRRSRRPGIAGRDRRDRQEIQCPPDGAEHLRLLLYPGQSLRHVLHRLRRQGLGGAVVAIRRHRHGDHRLLALGQDGRFRDRRPRQQIRYRRGRSAGVLRTGSEHDHHRAALRGSERRPRLRGSRQARRQEEAGGGAQGGPHLGRRQGGEFAHRRARRQRQDL